MKQKAKSPYERRWPGRLQPGGSRFATLVAEPTPGTGTSPYLPPPPSISEPIRPKRDARTLMGWVVVGGGIRNSPCFLSSPFLAYFHTVAGCFWSVGLKWGRKYGAPLPSVGSRALHCTQRAAPAEARTLIFARSHMPAVSAGHCPPLAGSEERKEQGRWRWGTRSLRDGLCSLSLRGWEPRRSA